MKYPTTILVFLFFFSYQSMKGQAFFMSTERTLLQQESGTYGATKLNVYDYDLDGDKDILYQGSVIGWLENLGGSYAEPALILDSYGVYGLADLDADGDTDLAGPHNRDYLDRLINDGASNFESFTWESYDDIFGDPGYFRGLHLADLNGDGRDDVITNERYYAAGFLEWQSFIMYYSVPDSGYSDYQNIATLPGDTGIIKISSADIDSDSDIDVFVLMEGGGLHWIENLGSDTYGAFLQINPNGGKDFDLGDFDGDGDLDILESTDSEIRWYSNTGSGFSSSTLIATISGAVKNLKMADLNGDAFDDLLFIKPNTKALSFQLNIGGSFGAPQYIPIPTTEYTVDDLNGDGDNDICLLAGGYDNVHVFENNGSGIFTGTLLLDNSDQLNDISDLWAADLDGDGDEDFLLSNGSDNPFTEDFNSAIRWVENTPDGTGAITEIDITVLGPILTQPADLDLDGDVDLISAQTKSPGTVFIHLNSSGGFAPPVSVFSSVEPIKDITQGDLNGDGLIDIVLMYEDTMLMHQVFAILNLGGGSYDTPIAVSTEYRFKGARLLATADIDGNGLDDIISSNEEELYWYPSLGSGFATRQDINLGFSSLEGYEVADLDLDGDLDIVALEGSGDKVKVYYNNGIGFDVPVEIYNGLGSEGPIVADYDLNGYPDIIALDHLILNDGAGNFEITERLDNNKSFMLAADVDQDGDKDILTASSLEICWFESIHCSGIEPTFSVINNVVDSYNDLVITSDNKRIIAAGSFDNGQTFSVDFIGCEGQSDSRFTHPGYGPGTKAVKLLELSQDTIYAVGSLFSDIIAEAPNGIIVHLDSRGEQYGGSSIYGSPGIPDVFTGIIETSDNNLMLSGFSGSGSSENAWILKLNKNRNLIWDKRLDLGESERANDILEVVGKFFIAGRTKIPGTNINRGLIARYASSGFKVWDKAEVDSTVWYDMCASSGDGFVVVGSKKYSNIDQDVIAAEYDKNGILLWLKTYGLPGQVEIGGSIIPYQDGFLIGGRRAADSLAWMIEIDASGNLIDEFTFSEGDRNAFTQFALFDDNKRFAAVGYSGEFSKPGAWLKVDYLPCPVPQGLSATPTSNTALITYNSYPRYFGAKLSGRKTSSASFQSIATTANPYTVGSLSPSTEYEWKAQARCTNSQLSKVSALDTFNTVALKQIAAQESLEIFPNPADDFVIIYSLNPREKISITNLQGEIVASYNGLNSGELKLNIQSWPAGVYFVNSGKEQLKLIIY